MTAPQDDTDAIHGFQINFTCAACPVQAEGVAYGKKFYFRSRHEHWSLRIGGDDPVGAPEWRHDEHYGQAPFDAGWITLEEALAFIAKALAKWKAERAAESET